MIPPNLGRPYWKPMPRCPRQARCWTGENVSYMGNCLKSNGCHVNYVLDLYGRVWFQDVFMEFYLGYCTVSYGLFGLL